jgi:type IV secretion system protein TrbL
MHKLLPLLVFLATASAFSQGSIAIELQSAVDVSGAGNALVLVGGMGGGTGGGMGGGAGAMAMPGGMGGMTGGGMTGGGMGGMAGGGMTGGMGGMFGGMSGYGVAPSNNFGSTSDGADPSSGGAQSSQYYLCVTPYDRCSFASSPGSRRSGSSCTCATGHRGTIK